MKVACLSLTVTDYSHRAITMPFIVVEVLVKVSVHDSHRLKIQSYLHATYPGESMCECGLSVYDSHRLKAQSYIHANYLSGSHMICKSGLSVLESHRLKAQSYLHATCSGRSICVSGLSVHTFTDCSHRAITMLLILVKVPVKVACRSTTGTDCSPRAIILFW